MNNDFGAFVRHMRDAQKQYGDIFFNAISDVEKKHPDLLKSFGLTQAQLMGIVAVLGPAIIQLQVQFFEDVYQQFLSKQTPKPPEKSCP